MTGMTTNTDTLRELAAWLEQEERKGGLPYTNVSVCEALRQAADTIDAQRKLLERALNAADISAIVLAKVEPSADKDSNDLLDETVLMNRELHCAITEHLKAHP